MGVGAGFCIGLYDVVVKKFTFAISFSDEFLCLPPTTWKEPVLCSNEVKVTRYCAKVTFVYFLLVTK